MNDEKVTTQVTVQKLGVVNKNGRVYDYDKATNEQISKSIELIQEELRSSIEKLQLSSMYGMFGEYGTFDKSKEIKVSRLEEDLDDHNGFKPGYLYCFQRQLEGSLCEKCESREQCIRDKENEVDRIKNIISIDIDNSPDISTINIINTSSIPIDDITSMRRKENGD